jgi:hypothetical protein
MDAFFTKLGRTVLERWKRENFSLGKFPEIARKSLEERPPSKHVDLPGLMRGFLLDEEQPFQTDSPFGEPEIVVYSHPRFYIQLLFWMEGTTEIHQHEFSGAFHVMRGSSISAEYEFDKDQAITPYMRVGRVRMKKIEILETGRTVGIISGKRDIHSLFHLDTPSVTVVVRTQHDPGTGPQLNYMPPSMAVDPHHSDLLTGRRNQLLDMLGEVEDPGYGELAMRMIADLDFERGFFVLQRCVGHLRQLDQWAGAITAFEKKHGAAAAGVEATLREEVRRDVIKSLRGSITDPDHRFFLALLMNAPTRGDLFSLVKKRYPKVAPAEVVLRWAGELMEVSDEGVAILDAVFPEMIDADGDARAELFLAAFRHFLKGGKKIPSALRGLSPREVRELKTAFAASALGILTV